MKEIKVVKIRSYNFFKRNKNQRTKTFQKKYLKFLIIIILLLIFRIVFKIRKKEFNIIERKKNKIYLEKNLTKKKVGIISLDHHKNVGNNLLKYAIYIQLKNLGVEPYIVGYHIKSNNIDFLKRETKLDIVKNFSNIKPNFYDILMVNSDQTWRYWNKRFLDIAFLNFAKNWSIPKFVYGASIGTEFWTFSKETNKIAKNLLKNFTDISVREIGTVDLVKKNLGLNASFVLDPTLLIDKKYYLGIINNYSCNFNITDDYIVTYKLDITSEMEKFIQKVKKELKYKIFDLHLSDDDYIEKFLYGIYHSKGVITDSYHGTIFSIIFNKPFIVFSNSFRGNERFNTLKVIFGIKDRFCNKGTIPDINLLKSPLNLDLQYFQYLRNQSINYLEKNLNLVNDK